MKIKPAILLLAVLTGPVLQAEIKPNALFSDNAVLQQGLDVPIWGTAREGEPVAVSIAGRQASTVARDGKWIVRLKNLPGGGPYTLTLKGDRELAFHNIMVGEVWVCSGQSNMERQLGPRPPQKPIFNWEQEVAAANYPAIRQFLVGRKTPAQPATEVEGKWVVCSPSTVATFTAVGYFFGRDIHLARKVPVGLIHTSWGGTCAEAWTRHEVMEQDPLLRPNLDKRDAAIKTYPAQLAKYRAEEPKLLAAYQTALAESAKNHTKPPAKPAPPRDPRGANTPSSLYHGMIAPLLPYGIRGVIWYQGESNAGNADVYRTLFPAMITDWRKQWGQGGFPFLYVQLAPFRGSNPWIREAQFLTLGKTPNTAMAVTTDCGDANDIHPPHKQPMGARLALAARALAYGERIEYSGPIFQKAESQPSSVVLSFTHAGGGLVAKDGPLKGFQIAGEDKKFVDAEARIEGDKVRVSSPQVGKPLAVRYGWSAVPDVNLFNQNGLPASPFRTDDWPK